MVADPNALAVTQVAYNAGFRGPALRTAVALGLAESNGNPLAHNPPPGQTSATDDSYGIWQINYKGDLYPSRFKQFGDPNGLIGPDPTGPQANANAKAAYALSGGGKNWQPWAADFNNGRYYQNLPAATAAVAQFGMSGASVGSPGAAPAVSPAGIPLPFAGDASAGAIDPAVVAQTGNVTNVAPDALNSGDHCIINLPKVSLGPLSTPSPCLLTTNVARAVGGVMIMWSGALVAGLGIALLAGKGSGVTAVLGKVSPKGMITAVAASKASRAQDRTDADVDAAGRRAALIDKEGQRKRARKAFAGVRRDPNEAF